MPFTPLTRLALIAAACLGLGAPALAQQAFVAEPVNLPPDSFTDDQFVDNNGCIFVRAGFDGNTTWVPRVTRSREPICGQEPTFDETATAAAEPADTERETPAPASVAVTVSAPEPTAAPVARPAASAMAEADTAPERPRTTRPQASVPPRIVRSVPRDRVVRVDRGTPLPDLTPLYRTTPAIVPASDVSSVGVSSRSWIVPRHVYENRVERGVTVPPGYERAWKDDRLNPWRAWQKIDGYRATQRVWTDTVPRQRIPSGAPAAVDDPTIAYRTTGPTPRTAIRVHGAEVRYVPIDRRW